MAMLCQLSVVALAVVIVDAAAPSSSCPPLEREGCDTKWYEDGMLGRKCQGCALVEGQVCDKFRTSLCPSHTVCAPEHDGESQFNDLFRCIPVGIGVTVPDNMSLEDIVQQMKELYPELFGNGDEASPTSSAVETSPSASSSSHHGRHSDAKRSFRLAVKSFADSPTPCLAHRESLESHRRRLKCDSEGFYVTTRLQCLNGSQCWCVSREGKLMSRTHKKNSGKKCGH